MPFLIIPLISAASESWRHRGDPVSAEGRAEPPQPSHCSALPAPPAHHGQEARRAVAADGAVGQAAAAQALDLLLGFLQHPTALGVLLLQVPQLRAQAQLRHGPIGDGAGLPPRPHQQPGDPWPGPPRAHLHPELLLHLFCHGQVLLELLHLRAVL